MTASDASHVTGSTTVTGTVGATHTATVTLLERARRQTVLANIVALAEALRAIGIGADLDAAKAAIAARYGVI